MNDNFFCFFKKKSQSFHLTSLAGQPDQLVLKPENWTATDAHIIHKHNQFGCNQFQ